MTNFEILSSKPEYLAELLSRGLYCGCCPAAEECDNCDASGCYLTLLSWLNRVAD